TSHYMKDVAALCRRVVVIAKGQIEYDGSLEGIVDKFSSHKVITLQFAADPLPANLDRFGEVLDASPPKARLKVQRDGIARVLAQVLAEHSIEDVSVEDPPLEEIISQVFRG
ncbi:MAG: ABC transporter, partial [Planctomycetales bacterium]|nr:ABC transporter [Planctomycetales bacterium]